MTAGGWLGYDRYERIEAAKDASVWDLTRGEARGPLRGVETICAARLERAERLVAAGEGGVYFVYDPQEPVEEGQWVNLIDPQVERCHCSDFLYRGETLKTPCKHVLAALLADGHPALLRLRERAQTRNAIAALMAP